MSSNVEEIRTEFASEEDKQAYIARRIEASRRKRANRRFEYCPACKGGVGTRQKLLLHLKKCCRDLLQHHRLTSVDNAEKFAEFLHDITQHEAELKSKAMFLRYLDPSRERRRTIEEVAGAMGLPIDRTERMLKMASKEIPLASDSDPIDILFEDDWIIAVQKPPFIITSPKHRFLGGTLFSRVYGYLGKEPYGLHRLDMNTSGAVAFAKDAISAEAVNAQFRNKTVRKAYLAICMGIPEDTEFVAETFIDADPDHDVAQRVWSEGKWSKTSFRVLDSCKDVRLMDGLRERGSKFQSTAATTGACLMLCTPLTGRTHQIRLHVAHKGHPIVGDDIYGITGPWIDRQALHAFRMCFDHPKTRESLTVTAPPPMDFRTALDRLGLRLPDV